MQNNASLTLKSIIDSKQLLSLLLTTAMLSGLLLAPQNAWAQEPPDGPSPAPSFAGPSPTIETNADSEPQETYDRQFAALINPLGLGLPLIIGFLVVQPEFQIGLTPVLAWTSSLHIYTFMGNF